jgi:hypothetical protein
MLDVETMGTEPNSIILTIGAVPFDKEGKPSLGRDFYFYKRVELQSYDKYKNMEYSFDWVTLLWWLRQDKNLIAESFLSQPRYPIWDVLQDFNDWIFAVCKMFDDYNLKIWSHSKNFDIVVLQNAFKSCDIECPWKYLDTRDTRTLYDLAGIDINEIKMSDELKFHNVIWNCFRQIEAINHAYKYVFHHNRT